MPGAMLLIHKNAAKTTELSFNTTSSSFYALDDLQPTLPEWRLISHRPAAQSYCGTEQAVQLDIVTYDQSSAWLSIDIHNHLYTRQIFNTGQ